MVDVAAIGYIGPHDERLAPQFLDIAGDALQSICAPGGQCETNVFAGEAPCRCRTDAAGRAGDNDYGFVHGLNSAMQIFCGDEAQTLLGERKGGIVGGIHFVHEVLLHGIPIAGCDHFFFSRK